MKKINEMLFSYYQGPISNKFPCKEMTLKEVYELITSGELGQLTLKVHGNNKLKTVILPYISVSGTFTCRRADSLVAYSGIICADFDHLEKYGLDVEDFKRTLANDKVLNLSLINASPSGSGVKAYCTIENAVAEEHNLYFEALYNYFLHTYEIKIDTACRDISRATFVNQDVTAIFTEGSIKREDLVALLPPATADAACTDAINRVSTPAHGYVSTATPVPAFTTPTRTDEPRPSDLLNRLPEIHDLAVSAMERSGWKQKSKELWTRPDKDVKEGCSAIWNVWEQEGLWILTVFSSNAQPFKAHKGYSDVQILCLLNYSDDWMACITDLASRYLEPL